MSKESKKNWGCRNC